MPSTAHGYPYPAGTDPVSQGAANIQALAEAVEKRAGTAAATPPASPVDGQLWYLPVGSGGVVWVFRYNAGSASPYKWEYVGGAPFLVVDLVGTPQTIAAASTWTDAPTMGPALTLPRAGDYDVTGAAMFTAPAATTVLAQLGVSNGATSPGLASANDLPGVSNETVTISGRLLACASGSDARLRYWVNVASYATVGNRWARFTPVRVS